LGVYRQTLPSIKFSGPTYFGPVLEAFLGHCRKQQGGIKPTNYNVLLILTDGTIHDMPRTKQLIVELSELPCSIIIVGLGDAEFDNMHELDGDGSNKLCDESGRVCLRDIV
jgi:hypothetical protein